MDFVRGSLKRCYFHGVPGESVYLLQVGNGLIADLGSLELEVADGIVSIGILQAENR